MQKCTASTAEISKDVCRAPFERGFHRVQWRQTPCWTSFSGNLTEPKQRSSVFWSGSRSATVSQRRGWRAEKLGLKTLNPKNCYDSFKNGAFREQHETQYVPLHSTSVLQSPTAESALLLKIKENSDKKKEKKRTVCSNEERLSIRDQEITLGKFWERFRYATIKLSIALFINSTSSFSLL